MKYMDTHAHYNDEIYENKVEETLLLCEEAGVTHIVNVGYDKVSSIKAIELSKQYDGMYVAIGIHPHDVKNGVVADIAALYETSIQDKIVAIGEIGLDYAFIKDNKAEQEKLFIHQIELANALKLPVIIHTRDASQDTYRILRENKPQHGLVFHCFHPTDDLVKMTLENGYMVAFGGNITYKRNQSFGEYIKKIPLEQIMIETDSPYLPPEPYRGQVNTSANLPIIANKLALYREEDLALVCEAVYHNSLRFFHIKI